MTVNEAKEDFERSPYYFPSEQAMLVLVKSLLERVKALEIEAIQAAHLDGRVFTPPYFDTFHKS